MMDLRPREREIGSLERATVGETVVLRCVLFDGVRLRLHRAGLSVGDRVRVRSGTLTHVVLETADGREVRLERRSARFIQVAEEGGRLRYAAPARPFTA